MLSGEPPRPIITISGPISAKGQAFGGKKSNKDKPSNDLRLFHQHIAPVVFLAQFLHPATLEDQMDSRTKTELQSAQSDFQMRKHVRETKLQSLPLQNKAFKRKNSGTTSFLVIVKVLYRQREAICNLSWLKWRSC